MDGKLEDLDSRFGEENVKHVIASMEMATLDAEEFQKRLFSYSNVLKRGRFKVTDYVYAVNYVAFRSMGESILDSWKKTFPDRCFREGLKKPAGTLRALSSLYDKNEMVQQMLGQVQVPMHIMFMSERFKAVTVLATIMSDDMESGRNRLDAADKLLNHVKIPETVKIELDIGVKTDDTLIELNEKLSALADLAQSRIQSNRLTPLDVIES